jgi:hypothetical protein
MLSLDYSSLIEELKKLKVEKSFFQPFEIGIILRFMDKLDGCLEFLMGSLKQLIASGEESAKKHSGFEKIEENLYTVLGVFQVLTNLKQSRLYFRSLDHIRDILRYTGSFDNMAACFQIIFNYFQDEKISKKDYSYIEKDIIAFFYLCKFALDHQNMYNTSSINITHYMRDDPRFDIFYKTLKPNEKESFQNLKGYSDYFLFEYTTPNPANRKYESIEKEQSSSLISRQMEEPKICRVEIDSLHEKYGDSMHIREVVSNIIADYTLKIEEESPLFDALVSRVRIAYNQREYLKRLQIIGVFIESLTVYGKDSLVG